MQPENDYVSESLAGTVALYIKNSNALIVRHTSFEIFKDLVALALDKEYGEKYRDLLKFETHDELHMKLIELEEICSRKNIDRDIESFLFSFGMEGSCSYTACGKVYDLMKDRDYVILDLSNYLDLLHRCQKSRRRLYWKYIFDI